VPPKEVVRRPARLLGPAGAAAAAAAALGGAAAR